MNEAHTSGHHIHPLCEFAQIFERDRRVVISWPGGHSSVGAWNGKWKKPVCCSSPARHPQKAAVQKYFQKSENSLASLWDFS